jgi:hypothetical protein
VNHSSEVRTYRDFRLSSGLVSDGTIHATDGVVHQAQVDETNAYITLANLPFTIDETGVDPCNKTLHPGVYFFSQRVRI